MTRRGRKTLLNELKKVVIHGEPHNLTFSPTGSMTPDEKKVLQAHLNERFKNWGESWLLSRIDELLQKEK